MLIMYLNISRLTQPVPAPRIPKQVSSSSRPPQNMAPPPQSVAPLPPTAAQPETFQQLQVIAARGSYRALYFSISTWQCPLHIEFIKVQSTMIDTFCTSP